MGRFICKNVPWYEFLILIYPRATYKTHRSMWTGVATCAGLSAYFLKQAYLDLPESGTAEVMKQARRQRSFLVVLAGASGVAGAYRFYLG